ncbi:MAG: glycosyltransferase family 2 protein [Acutalibacteraceae bacterium]|nr:glycosyltransferase family 2 protein [Acutalibacteraceae bacterium]
MTDVIVSIIMPLYNEEKHIKKCLDSLVAQTYPLDKTEWILVDGNSTDKTVQIIEDYKKSNLYPIILLHNTKRKTPYALNMAIQEAKGKYIIRLDAHSYFYPDYIEKCVHYLINKDADNVGGIAETEANNFIGKSIAKMISTKFGVGGSDFRIGYGNRYVDTVPFGAFKREVFEKVGLFNTKLLRSEDNDMNSRIRQSGGKIWLADDIRFKYYCRDTVKGILKMGIQNGNALFFTLKENPKAMSIRHFIPFLFLLSLIIMPIFMAIHPFFGYAFLLEGLLYVLLDLYFSFCNKDAKYGLITVWLYPLFHIVYGIGSLLGLLGIALY